jgi:glycosyltransferase involved in cell wall biosynthesis
MGSLGDCGLQDAVKYLGPKSLDQIVEEIDRCSVGVIPNRRSPFTEINMPTRIFEYLSRGKPVIAPRTAGIRDYFEEDQIVFFEPGDPDDLACKLQWVFTQKDEVNDLVENGQRVYQRHQWCEERTRFVSVVSALMNAPSSRPIARSFQAR